MPKISHYTPSLPLVTKGLGRATKAVKPAAPARGAAARPYSSTHGESMALRTQAVIALGLTALLAAGCSISNPFGRDRPRSQRPTPVVAAPAPSVTAMPLPPPPGAEAAPASGLAALDPAAQHTTGAVPASRDVQLGRTDFLGSWTIAAAGDSC